MWITVCGLTDGEFALVGFRFERGHMVRCFLLGFLLLPPPGELRFVLAGVLADEQVLGLLTSLVSSVSMLPLYPRMDARGRMINAAFTVSGAFVLGGQMAFAAGVADGRAVAAYFATKLAGGLLALILVFCFAKNTEAVYTTDISVTQGQK